ncbi:hypothetical protein Hypma_014200, partial [Hypsizygus marmoreus]
MPVSKLILSRSQFIVNDHRLFFLGPGPRDPRLFSPDLGPRGERYHRLPASNISWPMWWAVTYSPSLKGPSTDLRSSRLDLVLIVSIVGAVRSTATYPVGASPPS